MTAAEQDAALLEQLGFCWDFHGAAWEERFNVLRAYLRSGPWPSQGANSFLGERIPCGVGVKGQSRQFKFSDGKNTHMSIKRIRKLTILGSDFDPRKLEGVEEATCGTTS